MQSLNQIKCNVSIYEKLCVSTVEIYFPFVSNQFKDHMQIAF
jgi:hypothetical protein